MRKVFFVLFLFIIGFCAGTFAAAGDTLKGRVIKIVDGDTFDLLTHDLLTIRIRMNGIDCPEASQEHFKLCREALADYIFGKDVWLIVHGKDRWKRSLSDVFSGKRFINYEMVKSGYAWHFTRYSSDKRLAEAEKYARKKKKGIWKSGNPAPPWEFRKPVKNKSSLKKNF